MSAWKNIALLAGGFLIGTAGVKILGSKEARKVYAHTTAAMCALDYTMSELGGVSDFVREYTLASGGPYCDCGYKKKERRSNL